MPLILAIEPDRRQASQLKRLTRGCAAELVLADTTERALEAIGNRIPDLVLVPALLSPQDDASLATALRVIAAAAHVQTLTIPVFAPPSTPTAGGVLAKWRKGKSSPTSQGCDPAVFAEQIAAYLSEAAAAREDSAPAADDIVEVADVRADVRPDVRPGDGNDQPRHIEPATAFEAIEPAVPELWVESTDPVEPTMWAETAALVEAPASAEPAASEEWAQPVEAVSLLEAAAPPPVAPVLPEESETEWEAIEFEPEPLETGSAPFEARTIVPEPVVFEPVVLEFTPREAAPLEAAPLDAMAIDLPSFLAELETPRASEPIERVVAPPEPEPAPEPTPKVDRREAWAAMSLAPHRWPRLDVDAAPRRARKPAPEAPVIAKQPAPVVIVAAVPPRPEPILQETARPLAARPAPLRSEPTRSDPPKTEAPGTEWLDMLAALRKDIDRLRVQRTEAPAAKPVVRTQSPASPAPAPAAPVAPAKLAAAAKPVAVPAAATARKKKPAKEAGPIQDEWGFFDPQQCGFTALLAKLDEISNPTQ